MLKDFSNCLHSLDGVTVRYKLKEVRTDFCSAFARVWQSVYFLRLSKLWVVTIYQFHLVSCWLTRLLLSAPYVCDSFFRTVEVPVLYLAPR